MKQKLYLLFAGLFLLTVQLKAQAPNSLNYQGVARGITGEVLPDQTINLRFTIHQGAASGTAVYQETQLVTTNEFGLFTVSLGTGSIITGDFSTIAWGAGPYYLQVEMDPTGGSTFFNMGTNQFLSVPYALYAATAGNGGGTTYTAGTGIGITGTVISAQAANALWNANKLLGDSLSITAPTTGQVLEWNGVAWVPTTISGGGGNAWNLIGNSGTTAGTNFLGTTDAQDLVFKTNSTENMRILNSNGNVGIGTSSPAELLHVADVNNTSSDFGGYNFQIEVEAPSGTNAGIYLNGSTGNNGLAGIVDRGFNTAFYDGLNNNKDFRIAGVAGIDPDDLTNAKDGSAGITVSEASGNVGIGTSSPAQTLHVVETSNSGSDFGGYNFPIEVESQGGTNSGIYINGSTSNNGLAGIVESGFSSAFYSGLNNTTDYRIAGLPGIDEGDLSNAKDGSAGLTILNSNGNVGVGTSSPAQTLDVEGGNLQFGQALMPNGDPGTAGYVLQSNGANTAPTWVAGGGGGSGWSLTGNNISTNSGDNFLGTTNPTPVELVVNNTYTGAIDPSDANVYIGGYINGAPAGNFQTGVSANFTGGYNSVGIGAGALGALAPASTDAGQNYDEVAIGYGSLLSFNPNGSTYASSTAVGGITLRYATTGTPNEAFGYAALYNTITGSDNVAVGYEALENNIIASNNTAIGDYALFNSDEDESGNATQNTAVGMNTLGSVVDGSDITAIGYNANVGSDPLTNATAIGANATVNSSNTVQLGNGASVQFDQALMPGGDPGTAGYVLQSNGPNTAPTWVAPGAASVPSLTQNQIAYGSAGNLITSSSNWTYDGTNVSLSGGSIAIDNAQAIYLNSIGDTKWNISRNIGNGKNVTSNALNLTYANGPGEGLTMQDNSGNVDFEVLASTGAVTFDKAYTFPTTDGSSGQTLTTDGSGNISWASAAAAATPSLTQTQIAFGDASNLMTSSSNLIYDANNNVQLHNGNYALDNTHAIMFNGVGDANWIILRSLGNGKNVTSNALNLIYANGPGEGLTMQDNSGNVDFEVLASTGAVTFDKAYTFPTSDGTTGQVLTTDGSGDVSWASAGGGSGWNLTGNSGTTYGTNFIGTTDATNLMFQIEGTVSGRIEDENTENTSFGFTALAANSSATFNTAVGDFALGNLTSGDDNDAIGANSLAVLGSGQYNDAFGSSTLGNLSSGNANVAIGYQSALINTGAGNNTSVGYKSLFSNTSSQNTAVGASALINSAGAQNTAVGDSALTTNTLGTDNTALGYNANVGSGSLTNATAVGANAVVVESNTLVLGDTGVVHVTNVGIGTGAPATDAGLGIKGLHLETRNGNTLPTISINPINIGIGGAASFNATVGGTDMGGAITITTGGAGTGPGQQMTVNFATAYTTPPAVVITPTDATTAAAMLTQQPYVTSSTTGFDINFGEAGATGTTYNFNYFVIEAQ